MKATLSVALATVLTLAAFAGAEQLTARDIVNRAEVQTRGTTSYGEAEMTIENPDWTRTMRMRIWDDRDGDKAFVRILSPVKDRGTATLKLGETLRMYLPSIERSMKIPPSMMMQGWMGSDFTNDDMVKASSYVDDYVHTITDTTAIRDQEVFEITSIPREEAAVVWGKVVYYARTVDYLPVRQVYYDEDSVLVRRMELSEFREMGGRIIPTVQEIIPLTEEKEGHRTTYRIISMEFDIRIRPNVFTRANLERPR